MQRTAWATLSLVSGQSAYVGELVLAMEQVVEVIKPRVEQKKYLRNFFDKASRSVSCRGYIIDSHSQGNSRSVILARFTHALVKSRPLKEVGAEQVIQNWQTSYSSSYTAFVAPD